MRTFRIAPALVAVLLASGCKEDSNRPVAVPVYDPQGMAQKAMKELDKNGNGSLEGTELDSCPGLKQALAAFDTNSDHKISADELNKRFQSYKDGSAGAVTFNITVTLDGAPLGEALVTLSPESFMQGSVQEVTGRTDAHGVVQSFRVGDADLPGLPQGVYRVAVTKEGTSIPARYNSKTVLGCEVSGGGRGGNSTLELKLTRQ